jgi:hypothetical protein
MGKLIGLIGIVALIVLLVVIGPLATIWALNTLFPALAIGYTIDTWVAVVILGAFLRANVSIKKD